MCPFFSTAEQHFQLYLNDTQIPIIGEAKFIGLIFQSKLSFIPHITSLKSRCTKLLVLIKVLSNTTWGTDRKVLLRLYRALIRSKINYGYIVYGSARPLYIKRLDNIPNQGIQSCFGEFRTSLVHSLYVETNEAPLGMRRTRLSLQNVSNLCLMRWTLLIRRSYFSYFFLSHPTFPTFLFWLAACCYKIPLKCVNYLYDCKYFPRSPNLGHNISFYKIYTF